MLIDIDSIGVDRDRKIKILYYFKDNPKDIKEFPKDKISNELDILSREFMACCQCKEKGVNLCYQSHPCIHEIIVNSIRELILKTCVV